MGKTLRIQINRIVHKTYKDISYNAIRLVQILLFTLVKSNEHMYLFL